MEWAGGLRDLAGKQALEVALRRGTGGIELRLSAGAVRQAEALKVSTDVSRTCPSSQAHALSKTRSSRRDALQRQDSSYLRGIQNDADAQSITV